ncbi:MAG: response regulator [Oscillatoria sp. SIO1A7]|nr:response regulator [Oscillatoria sp. SIO1A7]
MSATNLHLEEFITPVPQVRLTVSLAELRSQLVASQGELWGEAIVVVNDKELPVGAIRLHSLMPYLISRDNAGQGESFWDRPLSGLDPSPIQPIEILPAHINLSQFWARARQQEKQNLLLEDWGLVNRAGKLLGLLDSKRLLKFMALNCNFSFASPPPPPPLPLSPGGTFYTLRQLLEQLPLPVRLQAADGKIMAENFAWRTCVGSPIAKEESSPLGRESEEESLGNLLDSSTFIPSSQMHEEDKGDEGDKGDEAISLPPTPYTVGVAAPSGQGGPTAYERELEPVSSLGMCPLPSNRERVWQFLKIPLAIESSAGALGNVELEDRYDGTHKGPSQLPTESSCSANQYDREEWEERERAREVLSNAEAIPKWLVLAQDVGDRMQLAKDLAAKNADLVQLNRLKDEFLACISHELKTPLTSVLGLSSLLKDRSLGQLNDRQARYAQMIYRSGRHLMAVVNDILDLTRMETGQMELIPEPVQIKGVCERAFEQAQQAYRVALSTEEDGIGEEPLFTLDIESGLDFIVADELRLRQMLCNLLSNALKFTLPTGKIGLRVSRWSGWIAFTVWDTGAGIPHEKQHLIFQKFQQLENTLTRQFEGTGLGLVLVRGIARAHGGDVTFMSKEGFGSQFTILLPPAPPQTSTFPGVRDKRLVLIVETVPRFIESLTGQLHALGFRVAIARAGTEALEKARRLQPKVVFVNPLLPLLSGWDVLTLLKSDPHTRHIPAIVMGTVAEEERAQDNNADGFLSLPVVEGALRKQLEPLMSQQAPDGESFPSTKLTILHLAASIESPNPPNYNVLLAEAANRPNGNGYRILEAEDLEQAELLVRIWQPDVMLLDTNSSLPNPTVLLQQICELSSLSALPIVTLDRQTTQAANQIPGLTVFPCLATSIEDSETARGEMPSPKSATEAASDRSPESSISSYPPANYLWQVIQVAAGMREKRSILVVDLSSLPEFSELETPDQEPKRNFPFTQTSAEKLPWLPALIQYLQTAGFKALRGYYWSEVWGQLQHQSVDLLLICLRSSRASPKLLKVMAALGQVADKPPILVLDRRWSSSVEPSVESEIPWRQGQDLESVLEAISTTILPPSISMTELLEEINQVLEHPHI